MPLGNPHAGVVELVDAPDSKFGSARSVGSSPTTRTTFGDSATVGIAMGAAGSDVARKLPMSR